MTTPPRIHDEELAAALHRIADRRRRIDDQQFGLIDAESPGQVLDFILDHPAKRYPDIDQDDVSDGQILEIWGWWKDREKQLRLLRRGVASGMSYSKLGARRGITAQGAKDQHDALEALFKYGRPDVKLTREARRLARREDDQVEPQVRWLVQNHDWVVEVAQLLVDIIPKASPDAASWLYEVREDLVEDEWSEGSLAVMGLAVGELRVTDGIREAAPQALTQRACRAVDELRAAFAVLGPRPKHKTACKPRKPRKSQRDVGAIGEVQNGMPHVAA